MSAAAVRSRASPHPAVPCLPHFIASMMEKGVTAALPSSCRRRQRGLGFGKEWWRRRRGLETQRCIFLGTTTSPEPIQILRGSSLCCGTPQRTNGQHRERREAASSVVIASGCFVEFEPADIALIRPDLAAATTVASVKFKALQFDGACC